MAGFLVVGAQEVLTSNPQRFHIRSDVFGFGVMLWALTNGTKPWPNLSANDAARQHVNGTRLAQPEGPLADAGLWRIMQRCWAHVPAERPSMAEVRDELAARLVEVSATPATAAEADSDSSADKDKETAKDEVEEDGEYDNYEADVTAAAAATTTRGAWTVQSQQAKEASGEEEDDDGEYDSYETDVAAAQHAQEAKATAMAQPQPQQQQEHPQEEQEEMDDKEANQSAEDDEEDDDYGDWQADKAVSARESALLQQLASMETELAAELEAKNAALAEIARLKQLLDVQAR